MDTGTLRPRPFFATARGLPNRPATAYKFRVGGVPASPAAVQWWDTHVYRTHLRSPATSLPGSPRSSPIYQSPGLSPRSLKARAKLNSSSGLTDTSGSFPGFVSGAGPSLKTSPRAAAHVPDPLMDTTPMAQGGVADHPLKQKLSELFRGLKLMDHDNDGNLHPTDIVRGLSAVGLSVHDPDSSKVINGLLMRAMQGSGMVKYAPFVYQLAADPGATGLIIAKMEAKEAARKAAAAKARAAAEAAANKGPAGPKLRDGVSANELRAAVSMIKDKMMDKFSGFTGAFRAMDKDGSGYISRGEIEDCLLTLNLNTIRKPVVDTLIDFIDCVNDVEDDDDAGATDIAYREFARAFAAEDIMTLQTLPEFTKPAMVATPPPTPPPQNLAASHVSSVIQSKFKPDQMRQAFEFFDKDGSKSLTRGEVKRILATWGSPLTDDELIELFKSTDKNGDNQIDYAEFCDLVAKHPEMTQTRTLTKNPALRKGVRADDLRRAQHLIQEHILTKFKKFQSAFKFMDKDRTGSITREELKQGLEELNLRLREDVCDNLLDFIDIDGGDIEYREFARVLSADDIMQMSPLSIGPAAVQKRSGIGRTKMTDMPGAQGLSWTTGGMA